MALGQSIVSFGETLKIFGSYKICIKYAIQCQLSWFLFKAKIEFCLFTVVAVLVGYNSG